MNINNRTEPSLELKISNLELDFYSRPIIESNGKKRWELIICSTRSYKTEDIFLWINLFFKKFNSIEQIVSSSTNKSLNTCGF